MKSICIVGTGYVGLATGTCLAELGNRVVCVDNNRAKIAQLRRRVSPIYEPGLTELLRRNVQERRLTFTSSIADGMREAEIVFIAVGTPPRPDGSADLSTIEQVAVQIARSLRHYAVVVEKSTVPVETGQWVAKTIRAHVRKGVSFDVASCPEFLREGTAVHDFMHPDRIVLGVESHRAEKTLRELFEPLDAPILVTNIKSAELIKHASNSFLATKISFINAVANLCERVGADVSQVAQGMGMDPRIGARFLNAGMGFGGFCLPKDIEAFHWISRKLGYDFELLNFVKRVNEGQKRLVVQKLQAALGDLKGKEIGILGLAFKPNTDDLRYAPALDVIALLKQKGARIRAYDPVAMPKARRLLKNVAFVRTAYDAARRADGLVIATEWDSFKELDWVRVKRLMKCPIVVDGRNLCDPETMRRTGFTYQGIGR